MNNYLQLRKLIQKWKNEPPEPGENPEENWKQFLGEQVTYVYYHPIKNQLVEMWQYNGEVIEVLFFSNGHIGPYYYIGEL